MAKHKFDVGDVVWLKSGGPAFVVERYVLGEETRVTGAKSSETLVMVSGWGRTGTSLEEAFFPEACLTKIQPGNGG